jgi:hypothetical protein
MYRIIYPNNNDSISIVIPVEDTVDLHKIAKANTPAGIPYKIINVNELPTDRTFRSAWTYDFTINDGYGENNDIN